MAPHDVWPQDVRQIGQKIDPQDTQNGNNDPGSSDPNDAPAAEAREDAVQASGFGRGSGAGRFLYPAAVIAGILFLIVLAAV